MEDFGAKLLGGRALNTSCRLCKEKRIKVSACTANSSCMCVGGSQQGLFTEEELEELYATGSGSTTRS